MKKMDKVDLSKELLDCSTVADLIRWFNSVKESYSGSQLIEVQEPHPKPPPRSSRGDYDVPHVISKRYNHFTQLLRNELTAFPSLLLEKSILSKKNH